MGLVTFSDQHVVTAGEAAAGVVEFIHRLGVVKKLRVSTWTAYNYTRGWERIRFVYGRPGWWIHVFAGVQGPANNALNVPGLPVEIETDYLNAVFTGGIAAADVLYHFISYEELP